jgi:carbonic anhydrase/acetyltransferase-like protein (isoleucine patch superfamily)
MPLYRLGEFAPEISAAAFIAPNATLIGRIALGEGSSIWFGAILRGDNEPIVIGPMSNVQESVVMHTDPGYPLTLGHRVTVGHQAMLHGCTVGDNALVGIQAVVLNGAVIGADSMVGAGAIVTERKSFPPRTLILGAPAKVVRDLTEAEVAALPGIAQSYRDRALRYRTHLSPVGD